MVVASSTEATFPRMLAGGGRHKPSRGGGGGATHISAHQGKPHYPLRARTEASSQQVRKQVGVGWGKM